MMTKRRARTNLYAKRPATDTPNTMTHTPGGTWAGRLLSITLGVLVTGLVMAGPASAHTALIDTTPDNGAVLTAAPAEVRLVFNEPVLLATDSIELSDATGRILPTGGRSEDTTVRVDLPRVLPDGGYVITWRVVSRDGHPLSGSLSFIVDVPGETVSAPKSSPPVAHAVVHAPVAAAPDPALSSQRVRSSIQGVHYVVLLLATGLLGFGLLLPRAVPAVLRRRVRRVGAVSAALAVLSGFALIPVSGAVKLGGSLPTMGSAAVWDPSLVGGEWLAAMLVAAGLAVLVTARAATSPVPGPARHALPVVGALIALSAPSLVGHTRSFDGEPLLMLTDLVHLVAGAAWFGGLVGLVMVLPTLVADRELAARVLSRFSAVAAASLVVLVAMGSVLAWRILGSWGQLFHTGYGALLLVKVGIVALAVMVAMMNRFVLLPRVRRSGGDGAADPSATRLIRRAIAVEAILLAGALITTGFLANHSTHGDEASATASGYSDED